MTVKKSKAGIIKYQSKMKSIKIIVFLLFCSATISAQALKGSIKDTAGEPLPYVNVGVVGKNIGTVTSEKGTFSLYIPEANNQDIIRLSMVGYEDLTFKVSDLRSVLEKNKELTLRGTITELKEIVISNRKLKEKILGNKTRSQGTTIAFDSNKLGNEIGMIMNIKKSPTRIKNFTASLASKENYPVKLRLNFYSVKNGMPDKILTNEQIIITAPKDNSLIEVDLDQYDIVVEDDFFVSLEWIETAPGGLIFSGKLFAKSVIIRDTSQGNWEKPGIMGVGFTCKVAY